MIWIAKRHVAGLLVGLAALACPACGESDKRAGEEGDGGALGDGGVTPLPPDGVSAQPSAGEVTVSWLDRSDNELEFAIGRAVVERADEIPPASSLVIIGSVAADQQSYTDRDVEAGTLYFYGVAARTARESSKMVLQSGAGVSLISGSSELRCRGAITPSDRDGDGLDDALEEQGWTVVVNEDGAEAITTRMVKSSPDRADTDGDGLCDGQESQLRIDPRRADTDGDGLSDLDEVNRWGSSPTNVDSDGDARGNPTFYDGAELLHFGTSPTLADSDGDGRSDFDEINQNATNPLLAELPEPKLEFVGRMDLGVNVVLENGSVRTDAVTSSYERRTANTLEQTSEVANSQTTERSYTLSTEATAGYPASAGVSASGSYSEKSSYVQETSASWSRQSTSGAQQSYQQLTSSAISERQEIESGRIAMNLEIANVGTRTFELSGLVVTALQRDRANPSRFTSIATLELPEEADRLVLGEGDRRGPFRVEATIPANAALDLLANPSTTFFRAASFELTDRGGENFAFTIGEDTSSRTALITLDYGGVRPLERYRVATNVERTQDGRAAGVRLGKVLEQILGLAPTVGFETAPNASNVRVLTRLRDVEALPRPGGGAERFWALIATPNEDSALAPVSERLLSKQIDFEDLVLMPRDAVTLAYVADRDGDGLFEREERMLGSSDALVDSDGDGLSDFVEAREGWDVQVDADFYRSHTRVYSHPAIADLDEDGWDDFAERQAGTDPNSNDTDADGLLDSVDPAPTQGPTGGWVQILGTSAAESVDHVLPTDDTVYVLGLSSGDLDGDGTAGGAFVLALEPSTGAVRWSKQFEGTTEYARKLVANPDGTVLWAAELAASVIPEAPQSAFYGLHWNSAGEVLHANDLSDAVGAGSLDRTRTIPYTASPVPGGGALVVLQYRQLNDQLATMYLRLDAQGANVTSVSMVQNAADVPVIQDSAASGHLLATSIDFGSGRCGVTLMRSVEPQGGFSVCASPTFPGLVRQIALGGDNSLYMSVHSGGADALVRSDLTGFQVPLYNEDSGKAVYDFPGFTSPRITSLDLDATNQLFVGVRGESGGAGLEFLGPDGRRARLLRLGNTTTTVTSSRRDRLGNLFVVGATAGGFEAHGASKGGADVLVIRNPQLVFPAEAQP